jgi:hypothetical protein
MKRWYTSYLDGFQGAFLSQRAYYGNETLQKYICLANGVHNYVINFLYQIM